VTFRLGLKQLIEHPNHLEAKRRYSEWLSEYQVVIAQVIRTYGDKTMNHPTDANADKAVVKADAKAKKVKADATAEKMNAKTDTAAIKVAGKADMKAVTAK
jgi:hypothetical protein